MCGRGGAIALRTGPRTAANRDHLVFADGMQGIVDVLLMGYRVMTMGFQGRPRVVPHPVV